MIWNKGVTQSPIEHASRNPVSLFHSHNTGIISLVLIALLLLTFVGTCTAAESVDNCYLRCIITNTPVYGSNSGIDVKSFCREQCASQNTPPSDLSVSIQKNGNSYTVGDRFSITVSVIDSSTKSPVSGASLNIEYYNQNTQQRFSQKGTTDSSGKYSTGVKWSENAVGSMNIKVTATKTPYNSGSSSTTVSVKSAQSTAEPIRASFTLSPQSGTVPLTVTFTDTSVGNPESRLWKFHDGQTFT